ncbi:MAG: D-alanine--D-alanine ligase [Deltaproteobacteria bacterium]|nr:D-alanine--D-alanine ligase [Deltaproteobacteria bacterium]
MNIGITYDLRDDYLAEGLSEEAVAEFDRKETIDAIEETLVSLEHSTARIGNVKALTERLAAGERWDLVFNIAEGLNGFGREAQVPALLDAYTIPYTFSDPLVLSITLHKAIAKTIVRSLGLPTPDFFVVTEISDLELAISRFPAFVKPVAEGTGKGITAASKVLDQRQLVSVCGEMLDAFRQPVLVETYLPGREVTVGVLGTGKEAMSLGVMEISLRNHAECDVYSYGNKERCEDLVTYCRVTDPMAKRAEEIALTIWRAIGGRDAGRIDFRADVDGVPNFMEVNPLAGLHPAHSDLCIIASQAGMSYQKLIKSIVESAMGRLS